MLRHYMHTLVHIFTVEEIFRFCARRVCTAMVRRRVFRYARIDLSVANIDQ